MRKSCFVVTLSIKIRRRSWVLAALLTASAGHGWAQEQPDYEQPPVSYSTSTARDAFAGLQKRIAAGELALDGSNQKTVQTLLDALGIPAESQILVFSKTS